MVKKVSVKSIVFALALPKIRQVISVSQAVEDEYIFRGLMKNKNTVIGNVVDAEVVRQKARENVTVSRWIWYIWVECRCRRIRWSFAKSCVK